MALIATNGTGTGPIELKIDLMSISEALGLAASTFGEALVLYPNPTGGSVNIELTLQGGEDLVIELFDIAGRKIADLERARVSAGTQVLTFDLGQHLNAIQLVLIKTTAGGQSDSRLQRFVK